MWGMILGILVLFGGIIIGAGGLFLHMMAIQNVVLILMLFCFIIGTWTVVFEFVTGGIGGTLAGARMGGTQVAILVGNDKKIRFKQSKMSEGMGHVRGIGQFIIRPDSVYNLPNGTTGYIAYYKYGVNLNPRFVRMTTKLKEAGILDIEQVEKLAEKDIKIETKDGGKTIKGRDLEVALDANREQN